MFGRSWEYRLLKNVSKLNSSVASRFIGRLADFNTSSLVDHRILDLVVLSLLESPLSPLSEAGFIVESMCSSSSGNNSNSSNHSHSSSGCSRRVDCCGVVGVGVGRVSYCRGIMNIYWCSFVFRRFSHSLATTLDHFLHLHKSKPGFILYKHSTYWRNVWRRKRNYTDIGCQAMGLWHIRIKKNIYTYIHI